MHFFQNRDQAMKAPSNLGQEGPRRYLKFWGNDYPYLSKIESGMNRWLPIPENSKAQCFIRNITGDQKF